MGRTKPITVYGPLGTESMLQGFLQYFGPNAAIRNSEADSLTRPNPRSIFRAREIRGDGLVYADRNVRVTALEDCHFHFARGTPAFGRQKSFAFRFETSAGTIVFSGDTGPCGGKLARFAKEADILVDEVVALDAMRRQLQSSREVGYSRKEIHKLMQIMRTEHSTPEAVGLRASTAHVGAIVLTHLVPGDPGEPDEEYSAGVRKYYSGPVYVAEDLMEFDIWKTGGGVKVHVAQ